MDDKLTELISRIRSKDLNTYDEATTKQALVMPILDVLGWVTSDPEQVRMEYSTRGQKVDLALRHNGTNRVFVEVKRVAEELDQHQEQLLGYSFAEGVKLAILTNGVTWWFFLPLREGEWEQRRFWTVEIVKQEVAEIVQRFKDFLYRDIVLSGKSIENAETYMSGKERVKAIKKALPEAWRGLLEGPDDILVQQLREATEKQCGYRVEETEVVPFLREVAGTSAPKPTPPIPIREGHRRPIGGPKPISQGAYHKVVLQILVELGGSADANEVLKRVPERVRLTDADREVLQGGSVRYEKHVNWARYQLVKRGYLERESPRGRWEITLAGREFLQQSQNAE